MKANYAILSCLFILFFLPSKAQTSFSDDFSDGDISNNPKWFGDTAKFQVNQSNQLQLNDTSNSGIAFLSTGSSAVINATWQFYIELDFDPSGNNFARVYLVSNKSNLSQSLNGYFVQIGGQSGTVDDVSLYRKDGNTEVKIIDGIDGTVGLSPKLMVQISRDSISTWSLEIDTSANFSNYTSQGTAVDTTYLNSSFMGVYSDFTSTRSDKFFFDDFIISGEIFKDTVKPKLLDLEVLDSLSLKLSFSESLKDSTVKIAANYTIDKGIGPLDSVNYLDLDSSIIIAHFSPAFRNDVTYNLTIENIQDRSANTIISKTHSFFYFIPAIPSFRDVQVNEFYADFSPSNGLPDGEFIELYNASNKIFDLENWQLTDGTSSATLGSIRLDPDEYLIICPLAFANDYSTFGTTQGQTAFPSLNNDGDSIRLVAPNNNIIDELSYDVNWYKDSDKKDGGWSIEQINPLGECLGINNYKASEDPSGGTPGQRNSVLDLLADRTPPELINAIVESEDTIILVFNETLDTSSVQQADYLFSSGNMASSVRPIESGSQLLLIIFPVLDSGKTFSIKVENLKDCSGNLIGNDESIELVLPESSKPFDLIINELLFNPRSGGSDFVELYNRSNKVLSLKNWAMTNKDGIAAKKTITEEEYLVYPNQFVGLTEDIANILANYPNTKAERFIEVEDLPSYNDDEGSAILISSSDRIIDQFNYSDEMHFELLNDDEGVSLERIDPDRPSSEEANFHSASESEGFATPGYENSQFLKSISPKGKVSLNPKTFSPDNDGIDDKVSINYKFDSPGFVANISIFDREGRLVKKLVNNELLGNSGSFIWDGISDDNQKARIGIYIVYFEVFDPKGNQEAYKLPLVLASFLD